MLLLSCPRNGRLSRASLLLLAAVLLCVTPVSVSLPAGTKCSVKDCAKQGRHFCEPNSSQCGPCLSPMKPNKDGLCVVKRRVRHAGAKCPYMDCAKQGRHFCEPNSSQCGPCLSPLKPNKDGLCVVRRRVRHGKVEIYPDLDEEIDFIHSVIEKQEVTEIKPTKQQSKHPAAVSDVKKSRTDASKQKLISQIRVLPETLEATTTAPNTPTAQPRATRVKGVGPIAIPASKNDHIIVIVISLCVVVGTVAVIVATACYIKLQKDMRLAQKVDYPAFRGAGVPPTTTNGPSMGDKNLAQSAQMYHYQHQKQQMLSMGNNKPEQKVLDTEVTSDEEEVGGDFTVYECPGLAPTGEMEVKNPLFDDSNLNYQGNHK